jgi:hypothetical protein
MFEFNQFNQDRIEPTCTALDYSKFRLYKKFPKKYMRCFWEEKINKKDVISLLIYMIKGLWFYKIKR